MCLEIIASYLHWCGRKIPLLRQLTAILSYHIHIGGTTILVIRCEYWQQVVCCWVAVRIGLSVEAHLIIMVVDYKLVLLCVV